MSTFRKNMKVVKILEGAGVRTAVVGLRIATIKKGRVQVDRDDTLWYDDTSGDEIDPAIPGFRSYLIAEDGA